MGVMAQIPNENIMSDRTLALRQAVNQVGPEPVEFSQQIPPQAV